ncbi:MAG: sugar ABC transporter permease [Spirochaetes bacterium]|jgi:D-xylose transport system permease protein|nr:sugar ABC transporter permease [Spirochaetota bacterium]
MNSAVSTENKPLNSKKNSFSFNIRDYTLILALVVIWAFFAILTDGVFMTSRNLSNLVRAMAAISALALGTFLIIVSGHIDLSSGSVCGFTGAIAAILNVWFEWDTTVSIGAALGLGIVIGLSQGYLIAYRKVPAFIVTLGGLMIYRGLLIGVTKGITVAPLSPNFTAIGQRYVPVLWGWGGAAVVVLVIWILEMRKRRSHMKYGFSAKSTDRTIAKSLLFTAVILTFVAVMNDYRGIPIPVFIILTIVFALIFLVSRTQFGRYVFALGGNVDAARLSGINVELNTMVLFVLGGFLASVGGIILTSRLNAATTSAGDMYAFDAIAACFIGGTSIKGGAGTVLGVLVGALVLASLDNGMSLLNTNAFWQYVVKGVILVAAVWFDISTRTKKV